jgi:hypothetical protein
VDLGAFLSASHALATHGLDEGVEIIAAIVIRDLVTGLDIFALILITCFTLVGGFGANLPAAVANDELPLLECDTGEETQTRLWIGRSEGDATVIMVV